MGLTWLCSKKDGAEGGRGVVVDSDWLVWFDQVIEGGYVEVRSQDEGLQL